MNRTLLMSAAVAAALMTGCAGYAPDRLAAGTPLDAVVRSMGNPTARTTLTDGGERLEFARGPYGRHTYLLDFDSNGHLVRTQQVLTEANFNTIQPGMDATQVIERIGHSFEHRVVGWAQKQTVWGYRYETPFCQWFQVGIDEKTGKVVDTSYGPDPVCDRQDAGESL